MVIRWYWIIFRVISDLYAGLLIKLKEEFNLMAQSVVTDSIFPASVQNEQQMAINPGKKGLTSPLSRNFQKQNRAGSTQCMADLSLHGCSVNEAEINLHNYSDDEADEINLHGCTLNNSDQTFHGSPHMDLDRSTMYVMVNNKIDNQRKEDVPEI